MPNPFERRSSSIDSPRFETACGVIVSAFSAHWAKLARSRRDVAAERETCFFAGSSAARATMARRFYRREHAKEIAALTDAQVRASLAPRLGHAARYWVDHPELIDNGLEGSLLRELPTKEYVTIVHSYHDRAYLIDRYPGERVLYDDLYERVCAGFSVGGTLRIYKSTGEPFGLAEARSVRAGVRDELVSGARSAGDGGNWETSLPAQELRTPGFEREDLSCVVVIEVREVIALSKSPSVHQPRSRSCR